MNLVNLLFVPGANATYMPLGIASLYSYIKKEFPAQKVFARDMSIALWNELAQENPSVALAQLFFKGQVGNFYNEELYRSYRENMQVLYRTMKELEDQIRGWLHKGEEGPLLSWLRNFILRELGENPAGITALSAMYPGQIPFLVVMAKVLRAQFPSMMIIAGGAALAALEIEELAVALKEVDLFYRGEGEEGLVSLLRGEEPATVPGVTYRAEGKIYSNTSPRAVPMDYLPIPDYSFCRLSEYLVPEPVLPVLFSRGCRWRRCGFCSHNASFAGYRTTEVTHFVTSLAYYRQQGIRSFYFADQYIGADDLAAISEEILERGLDIRFHVMGRPTDDYTKQRLELLFLAGCRWISWGVETGSQRLLDICHKGTNRFAVMQVLENTAAAGISNLAMMIYGMPTSDSAAFEETLTFCDALSSQVDAFTASSFQLFEGTPFWHKRGTLYLEPYEREVLVTMSDHKVHSHRWQYYFLDEDRNRCIPPGPTEVEQWKRWAFWSRGGTTFFETLPSEHYLLFATKKADDIHQNRRKPTQRPKRIA